MFRVGMKVVCVDPSDCHLGAGFSHGLRKNEVYTVTSIKTYDDDGSYLYLAEIGRGAWHVSRFRPAVDPKQEVSFTTGAPVDSERWDNRVKRRQQNAITALQS